jgi:hypothetical protein
MGSKCDDVEDQGTPGSCVVIDLRDGDEGTQPIDVSGHADPVAKFILNAGDRCPATAEQAMEKLGDQRVCPQGFIGGLQTAVVSETAQALGRPDLYRTVTARDCEIPGGFLVPRVLFETAFSQFGLRLGGPLPEAAEMMALDVERGVFNYYTLEQGRWGFHGSSLDLIEPGSESRCARCHTGGGPVMKEGPNPWVHWEGATDTPGAPELLDEHPDLGQRSSGATLEVMVNEGSALWNRTRIQHLLERNDVAGLLEPLFCAVELNIMTLDGVSLPGGMFVDPLLATTTMVFDAPAYATALADSDQVLLGNDGQPLLGPDGQPRRDTFFPLAVPTRAPVDGIHAILLQQIQVIDEEFTLDAVAVDFTRPVFSPSRCALLEFAPELDGLAAGPADPHPDGGVIPRPAPDLPARIRAGFIANLEAASSLSPAAAEFLQNLQLPDTVDLHRGRALGFVDTCAARDRVAFYRDYLTVAAARRAIARQRDVFEFLPTMPSGSSTATVPVLDPQTCELPG